MNKINFDFNEHKNKKEAVHCKTEEEAIQWCKFMHEHGLKWDFGFSYLEDNNWDIYKEETCYYFNRGYIDDVCWCKIGGYTIIEFSSLLSSKKVKL